MMARATLELSRAALNGQRGRVVVLKVYLDESGIHDGSPVVTVGAYMARPRQWQAFVRRWRAAIRPIKVYHSAEAASLHGEFEGWTSEQVGALCARALPIIPDNVLVGVGIGIHLHHFDDALRPHPDLREAFGTPYTACLHWVMATLLQAKAEQQSAERIAFFYEENDFAAEALATYHHLKENWNPLGAQMSFSFASKEEYPPLQAADVLAYEANKKDFGARVAK